MKYIIIIIISLLIQKNLRCQNYDIIEECMIDKFIAENNKYSSNDLYSACDSILIEIDLVNNGKMNLRDFWLKRRVVFKEIYHYMRQSNLEQNDCILTFFNELDLTNVEKASSDALKMTNHMYDNNPLYIILKKVLFGIDIDKLTSYECIYNQERGRNFLIYSELIERIFEFRMYRTTSEQFEEFKTKYDKSYEKLNCSDLYK